MKILNLYAGIGGNRKFWGDGHEVTAIEIDPKIAKIYQDFFPNDKVIVCDAHQYLLEHYKEFDFIWSSPPCPTHSRARFWASKGNIYKPVYPDMALYQEIIFLSNFFKGKFVVENPKSYYSPLTPAQEIGRHFIWANFKISKFKEIFPKDNIREMQKLYGINLSKYENIGGRGKTPLLRNCIHPKLGLHIFKCAFKDKQKTL